MRAIVLNFNETRLHLNIEAFALKTGYFLCDEVATAGRTGCNMYADEHMAKLSTKMELSLLVQRHKNNPELFEMIQKVMDTYKQSSKVKYRSAGQIAAQKKIEKAIHDLWMQAVAEYTELYKQSGMGALKLIFEEEVMGYYPIEMDPETALEESVKASDLLQGNTPDKDKVSEMFFLGAEFFLDDFKKPQLYDVTDAEAEDINNAYFHTCFTLPNLNLLTATELQTVRKQLQEPGKLFRQKTEEWMRLCSNNADAFIRTAHFKEYVLPATASLQQSIERNETLWHCNHLLKDEVKMDVLIGEVPVWLLWDFYRHFDAIKDATWDKLQQIKEAGNLHLQRWPVMVLNQSAAHTSPATSDAEEVISVKKSILID